MNNRISTHYKLNSTLSSLSNSEIKTMLKNNEVGSGWGKNFEVKLGGTKVFVKSIPLTELEYKNQFSTKNHFKLPLYYNYGVASAGMGAFRELNTHVKTTNWVLSGEIENFPLMYHYRIVKKDKTSKKWTKVDKKSHDDYVRYWNSSKRIDEYILERKKAKYEIIIFLEHFPHVMMKWLKPNISRINEMKAKSFKIFDFLQSKGIIHFDTHFGNLLTDEKNVFLTDFGLALDKNYHLSKKELEFYKEHKFYDHMEFLGCSSVFLESFWHDLSHKKKQLLEEEFNLNLETPYYEKIEIILDNIDEIQKTMRLSETYIKFLKKHMNVIKLSNSFFYGLRKDYKKRTKYPKRLVKKELE